MKTQIIATLFAASLAGAQTIANTISALPAVSPEQAAGKTIPGAPRNAVVQPGDGVLPVLMNGPGLRSVIQLVNLEDRIVDYQIFFVSGDGRSASMPIGDKGIVGQLQGVILPNSSIEMSTTGTGDTQTCWALALSAGRIATQFSLQERDSQGVWRSSTQLGSNSSVKKVRLVFDNTQNYATTAVLTNVNTEGNTLLSVTVRNTKGEELGGGQYSMAALNQYAIRLADEYPATIGQRGTLEISIPSSSRFGVGLMGVRMHNNGSFDLLDSLALVNWAN